MFSPIQLLVLALTTASAVAQPQLNITAIGARNGLSTLECWEVNSPFYTSSDPATAGAMISHLGNVSSLSWSIAPPGQYVGPHNAPYNQWVLLLKGFAHVTVPQANSAEVYLSPGEYGVLFAADTVDVSREGHTSRYLGATESVYLQIPTQDGEIPEHKTLHMGPCAAEEMVGWTRHFMEHSI